MVTMSKSNRPLGFYVLPQDGLVRLEAGQKLDIRAERLPRPSHDDALAFIQRARSTIAAHVFEVENELILVRLADRFRTVHLDAGGPDLEAEDQILRKQTFGQHVAAVIPILVREGLMTPALEADLRELLGVRNTLIHRPCWLEPVEDMAGVAIAFVAKIANDAFIWSVDDQQIDDWIALAGRCLQITAARLTLLQNGGEAPPQYEVARYPIGIKLPPGDPLGQHSNITGVGPRGGQLTMAEKT